MNQRGEEFRQRIQDHVDRYRASNGADGGTMGPGGSKVLLLTTTGRKTGKPSTVPLTYSEVGDELMIVASNGGLPSHPAWYLNLTAKPTVHLQVFDTHYPATARTATPEERAKLWPGLVERSPGYATYQSGVSREIPLVLLKRLPS